MTKEEIKERITLLCNELDDIIQEKQWIEDELDKLEELLEGMK